MLIGSLIGGRECRREGEGLFQVISCLIQILINILLKDILNYIQDYLVHLLLVTCFIGTRKVVRIISLAI